MDHITDIIRQAHSPIPNQSSELYAPQRQTMDPRACAPYTDSDRFVHCRSRIKIFTGRILITKGC